MHRFGAEVGNAVLGFERDVGRFVGLEFELFLAERDRGGIGIAIRDRRLGRVGLRPRVADDVRAVQDLDPDREVEGVARRRAGGAL